MSELPLEKNRALKGAGMVMAVNLLVFALLYLAIAWRFAVSLTVVGLVILALVLAERIGLIDRLFTLYSRHRWPALISLVILVLVFPWVIAGNPYLIHIAVMACLYGLISLGLNFQMGSTDMTNFASAAFFGMGAYTSALLSMRLGVSPWLGLPAGVLAAVLLGYLVGLPTLKTRGYYLSLVTIALQSAFTLLIINTDWVGGPNGVAGIPVFSLGPFSFRDSIVAFGVALPYQANYFYLAAGLLIFGAYAASRLHVSRVGLAWNAIGEDELAAICQGINPAGSKLMAFCIGAGFAGAAGWIYAHYLSYIGPDDFDFLKSLIAISMVILGGLDNVAGVVVGAGLLTLIDEKLRDYTDYRMLLYGAILLGVLILRPGGLIPKRVRRYDLIGRGGTLWNPEDTTWSAGARSGRTAWRR